MTPDGFDQAGFTAMSETVGAFRGSRAVIEARGEDTATFLQGQLSQDVANLAEGASTWSLLLAPQGKIVAWLRVSRLEPDVFLLDVDSGWAEAVITRLVRFRLRTKCELTELPWESIALRGPNAATTPIEGAVVTAAVTWSGVAGVDVLGPALTLPEGTTEVSEEAWTAHRIAAGEPMMGPEMDEGTIPAAAGIVDRSVSFTKGCYTGQELVARIDSRGGNVPQRLLGLLLGAGSPPALDAAVEANNKSAGRLTSIAWSPRHEQHIALGYIARAVESDETVTVGGNPAQLLGLPFPS